MGELVSRTAKLYWAGAALFAIGAGSLLFAATRGTGKQPEDGAARVPERHIIDDQHKRASAPDDSASRRPMQRQT